MGAAAWQQSLVRSHCWGTVVASDDYMRDVLARYAVSAEHTHQVELAARDVYQCVSAWAGSHLQRVQYSGSFAKGTTVRGGTDVDLFVSLKSSKGGPLRDIYDDLYSALAARWFSPRRQNVSIGLTVRGLSVDVVPARRHSGTGQYHSLYRNRTGTWTKTNVEQHIQIVRDSGRIDEIRATKIWRKLHGLEFPSIHLELAVIEALGRQRNGLAANFAKVLEWLSSQVQTAVILDPANTENVISEDLNASAKEAIATRAAWSLQQGYWGQIIW